MTTIEEQYAYALKQRHRKKQLGWKIFRILFLIAFFVFISFIISTYIISVYNIPSKSMYPTLDKGNRIIVNQLYPKYFPIQQGDIIVFEDPGGWLNPEEKQIANTLIKRVIAVGGDTVECCDPSGYIVVNKERIIEPYIDGGDVPSEKPFNATVPEGYYWVMGDNRSESNDSRYQKGDYMFVPAGNIKGKAFWILSPKFKTIE